MALLPQRQSGLLPKPRTQLLPLDMGASVRAEAEGHQQRFGALQGAYIPFPTMPTKEQIGQWALQNPLDAAALATSPVPVVGDVIGFAADAKALYDEPSWSNAGWMAAGLLPFVPAGTVKRVGDTLTAFHGSDVAGIKNFDITKSKRGPSLGRAVYMTPDMEEAKRYGKNIYGVEYSGSGIDLLNMADDQRKGVISALEEVVPQERLAGFGSVQKEYLDMSDPVAAERRFNELRDRTSGAWHDRAKASMGEDENGIFVQWMEPGLSSASDADLAAMVNEFAPELPRTLGYDWAKQGSEIAVYDPKNTKIMHQPLPTDQASQAGGLLGEAGTVKRVVGEGKKMYRGLGGAYDASKAGNYQMFTSSVDDAAEYARYGKDPTVVEAAIDRGNNLKISANGSNFNTISIDSLPGDVRAVLHPSIRESGIARTDDIAYAAQKAGYDSVTIDDVVDSRWGEKGSGKPVTVEAVFDPKRVTASNIDIPGSSSAKMTAKDDALLADLLGGPLPTDQASRMARAEQGSLPLGDVPDPEGARLRRAQKMGYNTDLELYRGTTAKGEREVPQSFEAGAGVFTSTNPDVADVFRYPREYGESVTEVFDDAVGDFVPVEPGDLQKVYARMQNPLVLRGDEAQAFTNDTAMQSRMIKDAIKRGKDSIILEDVVEGVGDNVHRGTTVVALKPVRSTNAKFDLNKADSADLMAGIAGGLLGLGAYNRLSAEEEY